MRAPRITITRPASPARSSHAFRLAGLVGLASAVLAGTGPAAALGPAGRTHALTGEQVWSVQMHMHGSFSEGSGSFEWHADQASQAGVDVIWWTDHDWRVENWRHTTRYDFESAVWNPAEQRFEEPDDAYPGELRYWEFGGAIGVPSPGLAVVDSTAFEGSRSLRFQLEQAFPTPQFGKYMIKQTTSFLQNMYCLASRPKVRFALRPDVFDPVEAKFVLELTFSEHPDDQPELRYVVGSMDGEGPHSIPLGYHPGVWTSYEIDVASDVIAHFTAGGADSIRGEDNNLFKLKIGLETRNGLVPVVFFDDLRYEWDDTLSGDDLLDRAREMFDHYGTIFPAVEHFTGTEISRWRAQPHMNGYAPGLSLVDYTGRVGSDSLDYAVDQIHAQGGAVSLNHRFGTSIYGDPSESAAQKDSRILFEKQALIGNRAYGVDVLEVGYRVRGGIDLDGHVDLWDALVGNAVFVTGNGISDSHGPFLFHGWGPWQSGVGNFENNFVTWLYAGSLTEAAFVHALKAGRAYFGDPFLFDGTIDLLALDGFEMGRVVLTDRASHDVIVDVTGAPEGGHVRLVQLEIRDQPGSPVPDPVLLREELLPVGPAGGAFADTIPIDTSLASFVRVELRDSTGAVHAFSNPLHFVRDVPTFGIAPERLGARLGELRITAAAGLTLTGATLLEPPRLVLSGAEEPAGSGFLEIDTGLLGAPAAVFGASTWNHAGGVLTLQDFSGASSVIEVLWNAVDVPGGRVRPRDVTLAPGRPNPFGTGIVARFELPAPAHVRLEVFDVNGRRVRRLVDEAFPAGSHPVSWDGRSGSGAPVANGVYLLRLEASGRVLTTKAIKVR